MGEKPEIVRFPEPTKRSWLSRLNDSATGSTPEDRAAMEIRILDSHAIVVHHNDRLRESRLLRRLDTMIAAETLVGEVEVDLALTERDLDLRGASGAADAIAHRRKQIGRIADRMISNEFDR